MRVGGRRDGGVAPALVPVFMARGGASNGLKAVSLLNQCNLVQQTALPRMGQRSAIHKWALPEAAFLICPED
uniref:Uncharacterized protein n=1 Tax=Ralstonia solanacearum TaxID=305 RepID=A0A0S4UU70_RALSL|nr:protein of unknown function [Ralstonia solanacearum]CUV34324.1 protein of unknown function [Ralstonia solanacearum]CUV42360.1 protein of unknown function [Ralstonia solanacearum]CUV61641.1 protein of unknown function [Ralstonia solanacearum]